MVRAAIALVVPVVCIVLLPGCSPAYEVRVPAGFAISSNIDDLRDAVAPEDGAIPRRVAIVAHEDETQLSFEICGSGKPGCRELAFAETGLDRSVDEVIETVAERPGIGRIVIVTDFQRRSVCERFDTAADDGVVPESDSLPVSCTSQARDETLDQLVDATDARIDIATDIVITIIGDASVSLIRRLGASGAGPREDGGGVVPELLFPAAGRRLRAAGYPVPASIAYDFAAIFAITDFNDDDSTQVYVPYGVFRY